MGIWEELKWSDLRVITQAVFGRGRGMLPFFNILD